jgi:catechol 2,3-dioxygenase-like lactoylglutathione lyase family enzyme
MDHTMPQVPVINIHLIDHVVVRAVDLEKRIRFYCNVLGCRLERGPGEIGLAQLRAGNSLIDLLDVAGSMGREGGLLPDVDAPNIDHFCVRVEPWHPQAIRAGLEGQGVNVS